MHSRRQQAAPLLSWDRYGVLRDAPVPRTAQLESVREEDFCHSCAHARCAPRRCLCYRHRLHTIFLSLHPVLAAYVACHDSFWLTRAWSPAPAFIPALQCLLLPLQFGSDITTILSARATPFALHTACHPHLPARTFVRKQRRRICARHIAAWLFSRLLYAQTTYRDACAYTHLSPHHLYTHRA